MRTVAIIQARMGSTRLPGKVLRPLAGDSMLAQGIRRVRRAKSIAHVVIATTTNPEDDLLVTEARRLGAQVYRGSSADVLDRYVGAARASSAEAIVRITSDCPLIDPCVIDETVAKLRNDVDYASNVSVRSYPRGLDCEVFHRDTLERMGRMATSRAAREHVTVFVHESPHLFRTAVQVADIDDSDLRWTVDTDVDLALIAELYRRYDLATSSVGYRTVVEAVRAEPGLATFNTHIAQKDWRSHAR